MLSSTGSFHGQAPRNGIGREPSWHPGVFEGGCSTRLDDGALTIIE
jgi:hypothetical protein